MRKRWGGILRGMGRTLVGAAAIVLTAGGLAAGGVIGGGQAAYAGDGTEELFGRLSAGTRVEEERAGRYAESPAQPTVYLTFDDGPSKHTAQVLDILKREQVPATFFVLGEYAENRKELVRRMVEEGHAVGNHSYNHIYQELYQSFDGFWKQTVRTDGILEEITGSKPVLLRAPGGTASNFDAFYFYHLEKAGYSVVDWNVDSRDAVRRGVKAEEILAEIRKSPLKHELTVLMHDGTGHEETVKALPDIIGYYREQGYAFAALDETVKPVQFRHGTSKWNRSYSLERFKALSAETELAAAGRGTLEAEDRKSEHRLAQQGAAALAESAEALQLQLAGREGAAPSGTPTAPDERSEGVAGGLKTESGSGISAASASFPSLRLMLGNNVLLLSEKQYALDGGRFSVPLGLLAEQLGGRVTWKDGGRVVAVKLGTTVLEFDPGRRLIREQRAGQRETVRYMADIKPAEGDIRVPLRVTAALLGSAVAGYSIGQDEHKVELALREPQGLHHAWTGGDPKRPMWIATFLDRLKLGISQSHV